MCEMPDRTPLLFLPGLLCDDRLWRDQFAPAALSTGGYVAFEILRQARGRVTRLALLATKAHDVYGLTGERRGQNS